MAGLSSEGLLGWQYPDRWYRGTSYRALLATGAHVGFVPITVWGRPSGALSRRDQIGFQL